MCFLCVLVRLIEVCLQHMQFCRKHKSRICTQMNQVGMRQIGSALVITCLKCSNNSFICAGAAIV